MRACKTIGLLVLTLLSGCGAKKTRPLIGFVTNSNSEFWVYAKAGATKAAAEAGVDLDFKITSNPAAAEQQEIIESLVANGADGIAISPISPPNQTPMLKRIGARVKIVCTDSDAPESGRVAYVGTDNIAAGRRAGEEIKRALPDGGKVMLFVGVLEALNATQRRQGILDALQGTAITVVDTRTDNASRDKARSNVEDALVAEPDLKCLVGLWSYNPPAILKAVKAQGRVGKIKIVAFDEESETLQGVEDGAIEATIVQQPYLFGLESVRMLAGLAQGKTGVIPKGGVLDIPVVVVRKEDVKAFRASLENLKN